MARLLAWTGWVVGFFYMVLFYEPTHTHLTAKHFFCFWCPDELLIAHRLTWSDMVPAATINGAVYAAIGFALGKSVAKPVKTQPSPAIKNKREPRKPEVSS